MNAPYQVTVVLDRSFGDRVYSLAENGPVWLIDSSMNRLAAEEYRKQHAVAGHLVGITTFKAAETASAEDALTEILDMIDLHHGEYSAPVPYSNLRVIGTSLTPQITAALSEYGFVGFEDASDGLRATKSGSSRHVS